MILRPVWISLWVSLGLLSAFLSVWGCKGTTSATSTRKGVYHTVKKGETLWRICYTYRVNMEEVCRINRIQNPEKIEIGQKIFIPGVRRIREVPGKIGKVSERIAREKDLEGAEMSGEGARAGFIWPVRGMVSKWYGVVNGKRHDGIDIVVPEGSPILAAQSGKVVYSDNGISGYGNLIILQHSNGMNTVYAHNKKNYVEVDTIVKKGQIIGEVGDTGKTTGAHLHFEIRNGSIPVDPMDYLP